MADLARCRDQFTILGERTYFAQQCLGAYPREMLYDLGAYAHTLTQRSRALPEWGQRWHEMHRLVERLLSAPRGSVFLRDSATAAQAALASALQPIGERKRVLTCSGDFHSSRYLWRAQARRGFEVDELAMEGDSSERAERIAASIDERVRVVAVSLVSPRTGELLDSSPIIAAARRMGALLILDAYQAVGIVPLQVADLGAHAVVGGFHKWLGGGGTGLAFGYVDPALLAELEPAYPGWMAHRDLLGFSDEFEPAESAEKLQQGMPAMEPIYTARAGLTWVLEQGVDRLRARSLQLTARIGAGLVEHGVAIATPRAAARRGGMVCVPLPDASRLVAELEREGIDIDARPGAGFRVGPHPCATEAECDHVVRRIVARLA
jgi:kynureninase